MAYFHQTGALIPGAKITVSTAGGSAGSDGYRGHGRSLRGTRAGSGRLHPRGRLRRVRAVSIKGHHNRGRSVEARGRGDGHRGGAAERSGHRRVADGERGGRWERQRSGAEGQDLDALSDDPDELSNELTALAGPSAGPNGGQIYIDGFSGGQLHRSLPSADPHQSDPFSAEFDRLGYGRIEI